MAVQRRRAALLEQYHFECQCEACQSEAAATAAAQAAAEAQKQRRRRQQQQACSPSPSSQKQAAEAEASSAAARHSRHTRALSVGFEAALQMMERGDIRDAAGVLDTTIARYLAAVCGEGGGVGGGGGGDESRGEAEDDLPPAMASMSAATQRQLSEVYDGQLSEAAVFASV
jgi:hypothetical protein